MVPPRRSVNGLLVGLTLLPLLAMVVALVVHGARNPGGDLALIELRVRDVGEHTPLLGSWGRYGFNQPGPLWFVVMAVPYRLLGSSYLGLQVATVVLNCLACAAIVSTFRRRAGDVPALWAAVVLALFVHALGARWLTDPWEPHALTISCLALVVLAWDVMAGRAGALPAVVALGSLLAQAQAGLMLFVGTMVLAAFGGVLIAHRRASSQPVPTRSLRPLAVGAAVLFVLWLPPLLALALHEPGNAAAMVHSLGAAQDTLGYGAAWRTVGLQLGGRPPWLGFSMPTSIFDKTVDLSAAPVMPLGAAVLGVVALVAARRRARSTADSAPAAAEPRRRLLIRHPSRNSK